MKILRILFILGFVLVLASIFVPWSYYGFSMDGSRVRLYESELERIRFNASGDLPVILFYVFWYGVHIAFIVLAIQCPSRWVFLSGSIFAALFLLYVFFRSEFDAEKLAHLMNVFGYALILTGYFIKPPKSTPKPSPASSADP